MTELLHIIDRGLIHLLAGISLSHMMWYVVSWMQRKRGLVWTWLPANKTGQFVLACLLVVLFAFAREPLDVAHGQWVGKAYTDLASWIIGCGLGYWDSIRIRK